MYMDAEESLNFIGSARHPFLSHYFEGQQRREGL